jgi:NADH-quinone oxidoreductase subunit G
MASFGSPNLDCRQDGAKLPAGPRGAYLFNSGIAGIEQADVILLVGTNPRSEAAIVNARIRKRWLRNGLTVGVVGPDVDLTYRTRHLGFGPETLAAIADGTDGFAELLRNAKAPLLIVGQGALERFQRAAHRGGAGRRHGPRLPAGSGRPRRRRHPRRRRQGRDRLRLAARGR